MLLPVATLSAPQDGHALPRLASVDVLRGAAALAVLLCHLPWAGPLPLGGEVPRGGLSEALHHGRAGVHLFFVVSGFCIHRGMAARGTVDWAGFARGRLRRLAPAYFVALAASLVGAFVYHGLLQGGLEQGFGAAFGAATPGALGWDLASLVLLRQNLTGAGERIQNVALWTLGVEVELYLLYPLLWWTARRWGWRRALAFAAAVTLATRALSVWGQWPVLLRVGPARWIEFALGACLAGGEPGRQPLPNWARSPWLVLVLSACAVAAWEVTEGGGPGAPGWVVTDPLWGCAAAALLAHLLKRPPTGRTAAALASVGAVSYSLYLVHVPVQGAARQLAQMLGLGDGSTGLLRLAAPLLAAALFYRVAERPWLQRRPPAAQP